MSEIDQGGAPEQPADDGSWLEEFQPDDAGEGYPGGREAALREAQEAQELEGLRSGDLVRETAAAADAYERDIQALIDQHPAMQTQAALEAMEPILDAVRAAGYDEEHVTDPEVVLRIYEQAGGDAAFAGELAHARNEQMYDSVFPDPEAKPDAFTA